MADVGSILRRKQQEERNNRERKKEEQEKRAKEERTRQQRGRFDNEAPPPRPDEASEGNRYSFKPPKPAPPKPDEASEANRYRPPQPSRPVTPVRERMTPDMRPTRNRPDEASEGSRYSYKPPVQEEEESDADRGRNRPAERRMYDVAPSRLQVGLTQPGVDRGPSGLGGTAPESDTLGTAWRPTGPALGPKTREEAEGEDRPNILGAGYMAASPLLRKPFDLGVQAGRELAPYAKQAGNWLNNQFDAAAQGSIQGRQELADSAAAERFGYTQEENQATFDQENLGIGPAWRQLKQGAQTVGQGLTDFAAGLTFEKYPKPLLDSAGTIGGGLMNVAGSSFKLNPTLGNVGQQLSNIGAGMQAGQDWMNTRQMPDAAGGGFSGQAYRAAIAGFGAATDPGRQSEGNPVEYSINEFKRVYNEMLGNYAVATTPTPLQQATNTPEELRKNRERSALNFADWGTSVEATQNTYDTLSDRNVKVQAQYALAKKYFDEGSALTGDMRSALWAKASDTYRQAYELEHAHPQALVNQNTNVGAQLAYEIVQPDLTDIFGGIMSLAQLTPAARRLNKVGGEYLISPEDAAKVLDNLALGPTARMATGAGTRGAFDKLIQNTVGTTGASRADQAADAVLRTGSTLLGDVETTSDARILLTILARNPAALIKGIPANLFQSAGLLARAGDDGLIRFGASGMNTKKFVESLNAYRSIADEFLPNAASLNAQQLNKVDVLTELVEAVQQGGYRHYGVSTALSDAAYGTSRARIKTTGRGFAQLEYLDKNGKLISTSDEMPIAEARKLQENIGKTVGKVQKFFGVDPMRRTSIPGAIATAQRKIVSPFFIYLSPGTWETNILGAAATLSGDGTLVGRPIRQIRDRLSKVYGDVAEATTARGLEGAAGSSTFAGQLGGGGLLAPLKKAYASIDEWFGDRAYLNSADRALAKYTPNAIAQTFLPVLKQAGVTDGRVAGQLINRLAEAYQAGDNTVDVLNKWLGGRTSAFSISNVNPLWADALPHELRSQFYKLIDNADPTAVQPGMQKLFDQAGSYYENLLREAPPIPQRWNWQAEGTAQDMADVDQLGRMAQKYGVPPETVIAWQKQNAQSMQEINQRLETLSSMVTESQDPNNRYLLYDIWGQMHEEDAAVRFKQAELAEETYQRTSGMRAGTPEANAIWQQTYYEPVRQMWDERHKKVNELLEKGASSLSGGQKFTPDYSDWDILERTARQDTARLQDTLRMEPESGRFDSRLGQVIEAGRKLTDQAVARTYAAARRFFTPATFDHIVSAERNAQIAGAQVSSYLNEIAQKVGPGGDWAGYFQTRNEVWRQFREYEGQVWKMAERQIVEDGINSEMRTGLRFDAGPDGNVELLYPVQKRRELPIKQKNAKGTKKDTGKVAVSETTEWVARREDGTTTMIPDNAVPAEIKQKYQKLGDEEIDAQVQMELDNIASAQPLADDAQRMVDQPTTRAEAGMAGVWRTPEGDQPVRIIKSSGANFEGVETYRVQMPDGSVVDADVDELYALTNGTELRKLTDIDTMRQARETTDNAEGMAETAGQSKQQMQAMWDRAHGSQTTSGVREGQRTNRYTQGESITAYGKKAVVEKVLQPGKNGAQRVRVRFNDGEVRVIQGTMLGAGQESGMPKLSELVARYRRVQSGKEDKFAIGGKAWDDSPIVQEFAQTLLGERATTQDLLRWVEQYAGMTDQTAAVGKRTAAAQADYVQAWNRTERIDPATAEQIRLDLNLGNQANLKDMEEAARITARRQTAAGGTKPPEMGTAAGWSLQQLEALKKYVFENLDEILRPTGAISEGQRLNVLDQFRRQVIPALDNVKVAAAEYGDKMRSFGMVDFSNKTRLDEIMGMAIPYGFWFTRSAKNAAERMLFEPQNFRRSMQADTAIREGNEQRGDPARFEGTVPLTIGDQTYRLRVSPSKYWPTLPLFIQNNYNDPESANNSLTFAVDSMRSANLNPFPWLGEGSKWAQGEGEDFYLANSLGSGAGTLAAAASYFFGPDVPKLLRPNFQEYNTGRELTLMMTEGAVVDGKPVTPEEIAIAQDMARQLKSGEDPLKIQAQYEPRVQKILDAAYKQAALNALVGSGTQWLTGVTARPFNESENVATEAQNQFFDRGEYNPETNPYGDKSLMEYTKQQAPYVDARMAQGSIFDLGKTRPAERLVNSKVYDDKDAIEVALNEAANTAGDAAIDANPNIKSSDIYTAKMNGAIEAAKEQMDPLLVDKWVKENTDPKTKKLRYGVGVGDLIKYVKGEAIPARYPDYAGEDTKVYVGDDTPGRDPLKTGLPPMGTTGFENLNPVTEREKRAEGVLYDASGVEESAVYPGADATPEQWDKYNADKAKDEAAQRTAAIAGLAALGYTTTEAAAMWEEWGNKFKTDKEVARGTEIVEQTAQVKDWWGDYNAIGEEDWDARRKYLLDNPDFAKYWNETNPDSADWWLGEGGGGEWADNWDAYKALEGDAKRQYFLDNPDFAKYYNGKYPKSANWWLDGASGGGKGGGSGDFRAARSAVTSTFGAEAATLWDEYYKLPKGSAREKFTEEHPEMKLLNFAGYNPDEYAAALEIFTPEELVDWAYAPAWDGTEETDNLRNEYWAEHPNAFLVKSWMDGRPTDDKTEGEYYNYGTDYAEASSLFGDDIWDVVADYKTLYGDKEAQRAYRDQFPAYNEWSDWWYGGLPDNKTYSAQRSGPGYDSLGHRAYGSYGGGGGGGGGGSSGIYRQDMPYIQAQHMNSSLWNTPGEGVRLWRPYEEQLRINPDLKPKGLKRTWA